MNILNRLADHARERVCAAKRRMPEETVRDRSLSLPRGSFALETALRKPGLSFICECKKASPSKGLIAEDFPYLQIAREYEAAGADAISVLTEPKWFLGSDEYLREIAGTVSIPCLRKDFLWLLSLLFTIYFLLAFFKKNFDCTPRHVGLQFPDQGLNLHSLQRDVES